ncbi:hypothetical protein DFH09DRAFT_1169375 [Mycena vulgaris]|nr:hypothetical protein DFH09DRAFT_1169375 [Mycena vulgaris]
MQLALSPQMAPYTSGKKLPMQRTVPMQVLALGFQRTGTASLKIALETLGYVRTNHGFSVFSRLEEINMWIQAIKAKFFGEGTPYGREEWDRLLGDCQAIADMPHILFAEELIAAYPEAKVVLTNRSPESWWKSYHATVLEIQRPTLRQRLNAWLDPQFRGRQQELARLGRLAMYKTEHLTEEIAKAGFLAHYEEVRRLTPRDRLLEFEVREGWTPLCNFLGKETPATDFPRVNHTAQFHETISAGRRAVLWRLAPKLVGPLLATVAAVILLCFGRMRTV